MVNRALYCGGPSVALKALMTTRRNTTEQFQSWPQLNGRWVIGTYRGRSAVALTCRLLGIGPGDEVLVPAYNCGTELDPLIRCGARVIGYQISLRCEIDLDDVLAKRTKSTRAVYIIHYFGWEQPMIELRRWCNEQGILLIEDCALALFSQGFSKAIGRVGDAAIFSLPKTLGFSHGGLLSLPASFFRRDLNLSKAGFSALLMELRSSVRSSILGGMDNFGVFGSYLAVRDRLRSLSSPKKELGEPPDMPDDYYFNPASDLNRGLHTLVNRLANSQRWQEIVKVRRENYLRLSSALAEVKNVRMLFPSLPDEVCPLSLPLLVNRRDACAAYFQANGIDALPWWAGFHRDAIDWSKHHDATWLKRNILTLPIHQGLDTRHIDYIAETASRYWLSGSNVANTPHNRSY